MDYSARKRDMPTMPVAERIKLNVTVKPFTGCWEWKGSKKRGYGHTIIGSKDLTDEGQSPASLVDWIIVGAETGNRKNKVVPKREWISELAECARKSNTPIFMKESLREIMGDDFRQEFPWGGDNR